MMRRMARIAVLCLGAIEVTVLAQTTEPLNFVSELEDFRKIRSMLPDHVHRLASMQLDERARQVSRLADRNQVTARQAYIRERIIQILGGFPERTPLNPRTVASLEREDYRIEKVIFESQPRFYVTANLYLPKQGKGPFPAILFPLGHEQGAKAHTAWQQVLVSLARRGFVGLAWDTIGQGERIQLYDLDFGTSKVIHSTTEHTLMGIQCLLIGDTLARYTIWDGLRALDYLVSRPEVDPTRIGCTGNSGGGTHTAYLSALEDRIKVAAPSCYLTSWRRLLETIGPQDAEQCFPFWLQNGLDHSDFVSAFAPKPYLVLSAIRDFFSINGARETYAEAKQLYGLLGAQERLQMVEADDGHGYTKPRRLAAYRWFSRWLKGVEDREPEGEVSIAPEAELWCTESGQVATSLGGETVISLNQKRFEQIRHKDPEWTSGAQLEAYRSRVQSDVRRLGGLASAPGGVPSAASSFGVIERPGYRIEKLVYESEPGIRIPALLFVPQGSESRRPAVIYVDGRGKAAGAGVGGDVEQLVQAGFVVLSIDLRGMGETQVPSDGDDFPRYFGDYESAMTALLVGKPLVGMRAFDIQRGLDVLAGRSDVDRERIYLFGKDKGAVPALYAAVLDDRIKKLALEGLLLSYQAVTSARIHRQVFEDVVVGALKSFDLPDLVAALSPRPVWIVNASDPLGHRAEFKAVQSQYASAQKAFRLAGAEEALRIEQRQTSAPLANVYKDWMK
jgi:cephalosporin-C deacetylase-like acetyl esterase